MRSLRTCRQAEYYQRKQKINEGDHDSLTFHQFRLLQRPEAEPPSARDDVGKAEPLRTATRQSREPVLSQRASCHVRRTTTSQEEKRNPGQENGNPNQGPDAGRGVASAVQFQAVANAR